MISEGNVRQVVEAGIAGTPVFIVDIKVRPGNKILILLDSDAGVTVDDCATVSRLVEASMSRDVEDFELEVSSAGLGEPLKLTRQFKKHLGKQVQALTREGIKITGKLLEASEEGIIIEEKTGKAGKKQTVINTINLTFDKLKETKLVVSF